MIKNSKQSKTNNNLMLSTLLYLVAGLVSLLIGAHFLVNSSSKLAVRFGVPAIFIGVTVVAFATSAPEVAVSLDAVFDGRAELALGNVLGSNIANVLLIFGLSAVIAPVAIKSRIIWRDVPVMILASAVVSVMSFDGVIRPVEGFVLLLLFAGFLVFQIYQARVDRVDSGESGQIEMRSIPAIRQIVFLAGGLGLLILGANLLVDSSIAIARYLGLSELVIGLTVIAIGTSLPEIATSMLATWQNEADLSVGNVIGSNIFNLLFVLALAAIFSAEGLVISDAALALDLPFMMAVSIACLPIFFTGHNIARWEGVVFLGYYAAYLLYLFLDTTQHEYLPLFNRVMALFVVPITVLTLVIVVVRSVKKSDK